ncbi:MAG: ABC transporter permease [Chloroflexi bacterium]|nr:ABC transporter permease [Chloroflexota bacterium]
MRSFYQLAFRNMRARFTRTLLTTAGIVLGVAVILAVAITNQSTLSSIGDLFDEVSGKSQLIVQSANDMGDGFDQNVLARVAAVEGVQTVAPSASARSLLASEAGQWQLAVNFATVGGSELQLFGADPLVDGEARVYQLIEGRLLRDAEEQAIVLVKEYADDKHISLNKNIQLLTATGIESFRVVGIIKKEGVGRLNNGRMGVVGLRVLQDKFERGRNIDMLDVVVEPALANSTDALKTVRRRIEDKLGTRFTVSYPASRGQLVAQLLETYQQGLAFFSAVALFVGAFLIYNVFNMNVVERTREIGMLRALGATRPQIMVLVMGEALLLGIGGTALGVGAGVAMASGLTALMAETMQIEIPKATVPLDGVIIAVATGIIVTLFAAFLPARRASRIAPMEALRPAGQSGAGRLNRIGWLVGLAMIVLALLLVFFAAFPSEILLAVGMFSMFSMLIGAALLIPAAMQRLEGVLRRVLRALFGGEGALGAGNVQRAPGRTALTVGALMVGVTMIIGLSGLTAAFRQDINKWMENALGGDLYVFSPLPMRTELGERMLTVDGVRVATPQRYFPVKRIDTATGMLDADTSILFEAIDPVTYLQTARFQFVTGTQGSEAELAAKLMRGDAVMLGASLAERLGLKQGDTIRLNTRRGPSDFEVAGIIVTFIAQGSTVTGSWEDMRRYWGLNDVSSFTVKLQPGADHETVAAAIKERYAGSYHLRIETSHEYHERIARVADQSFALFDVLNLIGVIVAALGVINTLIMNVMERQREIGMLRSLGMTRTQIGKLILSESAAIGIVGALFGLVFGLALAQILLRGVNDLNGYELQFVWPVAALVEGVIVALVVSQLAALYPAWRAASTNIVAAIQHE